MIRSNVESAIEAAHIRLDASQATDRGSLDPEARNAPTWDKPSSAEVARPLQMRFPSLDPEARDAPTWDKPSSTETARPLHMRCPSLEPEARDAPTWDKPSSTEAARLLQMKCPSCFGG